MSRLFVCLMLFGLIGCQQQATYPNRPITLVCPWAAGGGTDRCSRAIAMHLEQDLGVPVHVINATGGKGVTGHSRGLRARADGYTLTMITLEMNMMHWSGLTDLTYHDCIPLMSINEDYAAILVPADSPWQTVLDLEEAVRSDPGNLKASGTASGGAWHLALAGWLIAADMNADDIVWVSSTGAGPSLQELVSGGIDLVCCSLPEADSLMQSGEVRALAVMSPERVAGYEHVPTFSEQQREWSIGGWRGLAVPTDTPDAVVKQLETSLRKIVTGKTTIQGANGSQTFPEFMDEAGFNRPWKSRPDFLVFLETTDTKFGKLLRSEAMQSVSQDRYPPMAFPGSLMVLGAVCGIAILVRRDRTSVSSEVATFDATGSLRVLAVVGAVLFYWAFAEYLGFLITMTIVLAGLMFLFGVRPTQCLLLLLAVPAIYFAFAYLLRVPLPQGLLNF